MQTIKIKPSNPSFRPRDPVTTERLKSGGEIKEDNRYWQARLRDGSVVLVETANKKTAKKGDKS